MPEKIYNELIKLAQKAAQENEVPVSAIIVQNNEIIAKSYNKRVKKNNPLNHAEIEAIIKASKKLKSWRLSNCELYVTLKPCSMCEAIIKQARIKKVCYLLTKEPTKKEFYKTEITQTNISTQQEIYHQILHNFFKAKRH